MKREEQTYNKRKVATKKEENRPKSNVNVGVLI